MGDVARDAQRADDLTPRIPVGHRVRLQPAPRALQPDDLKLATPGAAGHHALVHFIKGGAMLRHDEVRDGPIAHLIDRRGFNHRKPRGIHLDQPAVRREELHAFGLDLDDLAQVLLALVQRHLRAFALGDVALDAEEARHRAALIMHRGDEQRIPESRAILAVVQDLAVEETVPMQRGLQFFPGRRIGVRALEKAATFPQQLRLGVTGEPREALIRIGDAPVQPREQDAERDIAERVLEKPLDARGLHARRLHRRDQPTEHCRRSHE